MNTKAFLDKLDKLFPKAECELEFNSPFELLIAVVLSAQCTDKRVNMVTSEMFKKYNKPQDYATMKQEKLEELIHSCGFYHNKAKNIISMSRDIISKFNGQVPNTLEELQTLAGVGRKTANVVYAEAFGGDAIAVDTHVLRVSNRLGFVKTDDPLKCELKLMDVFPKDCWSTVHIQLVLFGRYICKSQKPDCEKCPFYDMCVYENKKEF